MQVRQFLAEAAPQSMRPNAIIAPHAGYGYSGPVAASAYAAVRNVAGCVRRVILLGPCHIPHPSGLVTTSAESFSTPLGDVPVDRKMIRTALDNLEVTVDDAPHRKDHSLVVQLPFLMEVLQRFSVAPFLVGTENTDSVAELLQLLADHDDALVVVSSDLSHYHDYSEACRIDRETAEAIVSLQPARLHPNQACGCTAITGLLHYARDRGLRASLLDLRNSGDTAGPRHRVVGYGAFVFE